MHHPLAALRRKQRFQQRRGRLDFDCVSDFAVFKLPFCMLLSVYSKPSPAGELSSLLLPSILAGAVLDHVLLLSGSCALRNTRWHLGTVPSHPDWPVLGHFQSSGNAGGTEASTDLFPSRM